MRTGEPISTKPPSGFRDFVGHEAERRAHLVQQISQVYESFGFSPIETSALESLQVLEGSGGGEENEKLIFKILKRGEKFKEVLPSAQSESDLADFGLRFDLTVPLARVVAEYQSKIKMPAKIFHIAPVWRAERAQKGRFREFYQCDVDIIGSSDCSAEVDVIHAVVTAVSSIAGNDFELRVNDRKLLRSLAESFGFADDKADAFAIILDKADKVEFNQLIEEWTTLLGRSLPKRLTELHSKPFDLNECRDFNLEAVNNLERLLGVLKDLNLPLKSIKFDATLARGLGYYTGPVFELRHHSAGYSLGGGGRYDGLIGRFMKNSVPACGFSIGFERLLMLLDSQESVDSKILFFPVIDESHRSAVIRLAHSLRLKGWKASVFPSSAKLKNQLKFASDQGMRWVVVAGPDELARNELILKDFKNGQEMSIKLDSLDETLKNIIKT